MNIKNAFNVRDQLAFKGIMATLTPITDGMAEPEAREMEDKLWQCFIAADKKWEREFIPSVMPGDQAKSFLDIIGSGPK